MKCLSKYQAKHLESEEIHLHDLPKANWPASQLVTDGFEVVGAEARPGRQLASGAFEETSK